MPFGVCLHPCARLLAGHPVDPTTVVCGAHTLVWLVRTGHGGVLHSVYLGGSHGAAVLPEPVSLGFAVMRGWLSPVAGRERQSRLLPCPCGWVARWLVGGIPSPPALAVWSFQCSLAAVVGGASF